MPDTYPFGGKDLETDPPKSSRWICRITMLLLENYKRWGKNIVYNSGFFQCQIWCLQTIPYKILASQQFLSSHRWNLRMCSSEIWTLCHASDFDSLAANLLRRWESFWIYVSEQFGAAFSGICCSGCSFCDTQSSGYSFRSGHGIRSTRRGRATSLYSWRLEWAETLVGAPSAQFSQENPVQGLLVAVLKQNPHLHSDWNQQPDFD